MKKLGSKIGSWSFGIGLILATIIAIMNSVMVPSWAIITLAILGVLVGLFNIGVGEVQPFLIAGIAFLISFQSLSAIIQSITLGWQAVGTFFALLSIFIAPALAVVAVIALFKISKD